MWVQRQLDDGSAQQQASGGGSDIAPWLLEWAENIDAGFTRGSGANVSRTVLKLRRTDGTAVYISVDTGTTVVCSTTAP